MNTKINHNFKNDVVRRTYKISSKDNETVIYDISETKAVQSRDETVESWTWDYFLEIIGRIY